MKNGHRLGGLIGEREQHSVEKEIRRNKKWRAWKCCCGAKMQNDCSGEHSPGICREHGVVRNISMARK